MASKLTKYSLLSSFVWKFLERGGKQIASLVVQIVLARLLAPEQFGALAIMLVFINVGNVFVQSGLNTALIQSRKIDDADCCTVFWLSIGIALFLYVIIFIASPFIAAFYGMYDLLFPLRVLSIILFITPLNSIQTALVQRDFEFKSLFHATMFSLVISSTLGIGLALGGFGLWALVAQQLSFQIFNCIALFVQLKWLPRFVFSLDKAKRLFSFGWKILVSGILDQGYQSLSDLIIGKQFSAYSLGLVSQGKKYPQALGSLLDGAIQPVMLSAVAHVQDDIDKVKRLVRRALKTSTYLILPCMTLFAVVAEPVVRLLLGEQWIAAVPFLQMYCFNYALLPIHTSNLQALNGMGRSDLFLKLEVIKKVYGVFFIIIGAFIFNNVYILVASYMVSSIISTFVNAWPNRKVIGYSYIEQIKDVFPAFVLVAVSAGFAIPVGMFPLPDIVIVLLQAVVMVAVYLGLSKLFKVEAFDYLLATAKEVIVLHKG